MSEGNTWGFYGRGRELKEIDAIKDTELDFVAMDEDSKVIRLATCKRSASKLLDDLSNFDGHVQRFLQSFGRFQDWTVQKMAISVELSSQERRAIASSGYIAQDLPELLMPFAR